ncbi:MAG: GNAT family N-acetyltransferase [Caldilineaceae bacterium]|nr:GNAT family N-acetyltransferase [Caldilineaceae bacterium]
MIRLLTQAHQAAAQELLEQKPAQNLYLLGNMAVLGMEHPDCQFWGDFGADGQLRGVLNRYMSGWTLYGTPDADWPGLAAIIDSYPLPATRLQDNPGGVESVLPWLTRYRAVKVSVEELMELEADAFRSLATREPMLVRRADLVDLDALIGFYAEAEHMARTPTNVERPIRNTRLFVAEETGNASAETAPYGLPAIRSAALTNAETATLAMIGGVYTPPAYRGRGLSQAVCSALCADLLAAGKRPVLYWETPAAGAVYRKLGFTRVGDWRSVWLA